MNKRMLLIISTLFISVLLMVSSSFAQAPRNPDYESEGKTVYTDLAVTGLDVTGVPGYVEMNNGYGSQFYLYVDRSGLLMIASAVTVGLSASPQTSSWTTGYLGKGSKVGGQ